MILIHPIERALAASALVPSDGVVVVAVSGGADSMALVEALRNAAHGALRKFASGARGAHPRPAAGRDGVRFIVAHFDHRLRNDSARDAEHVAEYARAHGLEFVLGSDDVARRARVGRLSIEEAARDARYEFFYATALRVGAACVATAHTRSDQVETILMRVLRGSGRAGLAGIPERRGALVRPLLDVTRHDARDYCAARGVAFVDDPSNDDVRFFRNRVRHEILPELRAVFPSIDDVLLRLAREARRQHDDFARREHEWLRDSVREETAGVWTLSLTAFAALDDDDATALLREALAHAGLARDVGRAHYARLLELARSTHAGSSVDLPGVRARREHDALVLSPRDHTRAVGGASTLSIPGETRTGDWIIDADYVAPDDARRAIASREMNDDDAYFEAAAISRGLIVRAARPGDAMRPFGLGGRKKLSDLCVDRKIPRRRRERLVVIEGDAIVWVPGVARSDVGAVGEGTTRVVRLRARPSGIDA